MYRLIGKYDISSAGLKKYKMQYLREKAIFDCLHLAMCQTVRLVDVKISKSGLLFHDISVK